MSISLLNNTDCFPVCGGDDATLCGWLLIKNAREYVGQGMYGSLGHQESRLGRKWMTRIKATGRSSLIAILAPLHAPFVVLKARLLLTCCMRITPHDYLTLSTTSSMIFLCQLWSSLSNVHS